MPTQIIKVSQLNRYVRAQLEENTLLGDLLVKGDFSSVSWRRTSIFPYTACNVNRCASASVIATSPMSPQCHTSLQSLKNSTIFGSNHP